jgi:hypothetical protein
MEIESPEALWVYLKAIGLRSGKQEKRHSLDRFVESTLVIRVYVKKGTTLALANLIVLQRMNTNGIGTEHFPGGAQLQVKKVTRT